MSKILDDYNQENYIQRAVRLINHLNDLKAQKTQVQNDIATHKTLVLSEVNADQWKATTFRLANQLLESIISLNQKIPDAKTELSNLKDLIIDAQYKIDIQAEIES